MVMGASCRNRFLTSEEISSLVGKASASLNVEGKRLLILIPDGTRTMPLPMMVELFEKYLGKRAKKMDYLVALGTHQPMNDEQLSSLTGEKVMKGKFNSRQIINHEWSDASSFVQIGEISAQEISEITLGLLKETIPVSLNKIIQDYDQLLICGPVFPHEVAGFSGGNKYLFPGIAGPEIINFTHWLGAMLTNFRIIGSGCTPVRAVIDRAAAFIQQPVSCISLVVTPEGVCGLFFGSAQESWEAAAELSAQKHIVYVDQPYKKVISVMPAIYDDLWTAAKGMYKMEPVIADGGEVVIYAPHIHEVSYTHGKLLDEIGYHCRDYYLKQWQKFQHYPRGVLAHSTHLRGLGSYDEKTATESLRIRVTLATGIPEERCLKIGLGYLDPNSFNPEDLIGREDRGMLVVPRAGEMLYRLKNAVQE